MRMTTASVGVEAMPVTASSESADIMTDEVIIRPLPPAPKSLAGHNELKGKNFQVTVSNKAGYLCHLALEGTWNVAPDDVFQLFSYPGDCVHHTGETALTNGLRTVLGLAAGFMLNPMTGLK